MIDVNSKSNKARRRDLIKTYVKSPQFGLVLGAGVAAQSFVPTYDELALRILERASDQGHLMLDKQWVKSFARHQRALLKKEDRKTIPPEEILLLVRRQLNDQVELLRKLAQEVLYQQAAVGVTAGRDVFVNNPTLNAILTFCAARPGTVLAPDSSRYAIEANVKVGGILTTNYDNLVESAFHTKYRRPLLRPVGRPTSAESSPKIRVIPVYHIHGYIGFRQEESRAEEAENGDHDTNASDIVIAETDYFRTFYDPLGFGNYISMSFLRRFPCLFIGASMKDKNLRRFLFHLAQDSHQAAQPWYQRKFAILKTCGSADEELTDTLLSSSYGVETIWIDAFSEIESLLREMYSAVPGVEDGAWEYVANYKWG